MQYTYKLFNDTSVRLIKGTAVSRKSIAAFIAATVENPDQWKAENLGISKPG